MGSRAFVDQGPFDRLLWEGHGGWLNNIVNLLVHAGDLQMSEHGDASEYFVLLLNGHCSVTQRVHVAVSEPTRAAYQNMRN